MKKKKRLLTLLFITNIALFADASELYKSCAGCHGEQGEEIALQQSAIIGGQESNLTIKQLTAYKYGELNQYGLGNVMKLQLTMVSEDKIEELADYISKMDAKSSKKED